MKTNNPYLKLKVAIGIVGTIAIIGGIATGGYYLFVKKDFKKVYVENQLIKSVQEANRNCPVMVDEDSRLEGVMYREGPELEYRYTLINLLAEEYDASLAQRIVEESIIDNIKKDESLAFAKSNQVTFTYIFNDKHGDFLLKVRVTPDKYK